MTNSTTSLTSDTKPHLKAVRPSSTSKKIEASSSHTGHRARLRDRFLKVGSEGLADYELLELLLFGALPRGDTKPLAKALIHEFGSLKNVLTAEPVALKEIPGVAESVVSALKLAETLGRYLLKEDIRHCPLMGSVQDVADYCRAAMGHLKHEQFHLLFLDQKNKLIADEVQQKGTVDRAPLFPREIIKRALELGACSLILAHNHPSGDTTPSQADITLTRRVRQAAELMGIDVHDHLIVGRNGYSSLRSLGHL